jgi:hypothetical protein
MKKACLIFALAAMPLAAQSWEVGAFIGQQTYDKFTAEGFEYKPDNKVMFAVRAGYSFVDLGPALFQINAGYQPKASATVKISGADIGVKLDHEATSLGLAFIFKAGMSVGVGVDYRWDKLEGSFMGVNSSTTYGRPWARANIGFAFPTPVIKPFVGLEVAAALSSKSIGATGPTTDEEALKGLAPKLQIGLYAGLRF